MVDNSVTLSFRILNAFPAVLPSNVEWFFYGTALSDSVSRYSFSSDRLSLTVSALTHDDEGLYTLTAANEAGSGSASLFLKIEGKALKENGRLLMCMYVYIVHVYKPLAFLP